jgi:hypothetical protein
MMVVELFTTFFRSFPIATFRGANIATSRSGKVFSVFRDDELIAELSSALEWLAPPPGAHRARQARVLLTAADVDHDAAVQSIVDRFTTMRDKFQRDDEIVRRIVNLLLSVGNALSAEATNAARFFDRAGPNANQLATVLGSVDANDKLSALDTAQVTLSRNAMAEQLAMRTSAAAIASRVGANTSQSPDVTPFIDDSVIPFDVKRALFAMLREPSFVAPASSNLRILSVGLPAGFMQALHERVSTHVVGHDFAELGRRRALKNDVVKVHVYLKDLLFEDIVFKPKSFVFELSRFIAAPDFMGLSQDALTFDAVLRNVRTRVLTPDGSTFITEAGPDTATSAGYEGVINAEQRAELLGNHVKSYLLRLYIRLLSGVDLTEDNFFINDRVADLRVDTETRALFEQLVNTRVSKLAGRSLTLDDLRAADPALRDLLDRVSDDPVTAGSIEPLRRLFDDASKAANIEISDDLLTFLRVFSPRSVLFGAGSRRSRVVSPKLFERVFNMAVDPDEFEIDQDLMQSTASGRSFMVSDVGSRLIERLTVGQGSAFDVPRLPVNQYAPAVINRAVRREFGNLTLQQFFVVVEQLPELPPIGQVAPNNVAIRGNVDVQPEHRSGVTLGDSFDVSVTRNSGRDVTFDASQTARRDEGSEWSRMV